MEFKVKIIKSLIVISCILLSSNIAYSENINIKVETKIHLMPNDERYLEIKNQKILRAIGERQWIMQNERSFCPNYDEIKNELIKKGQYKTAIAILEKNKNNNYCNIGEVNRLLGFAYYKSEDYINSIKNYNLYIESSKVINPLIYYERGLVRSKIGDYLGAVEDYNIAVQNGLPQNDTFITGETIFDYTKNRKENINENLDLKISKYFILPTSKDTANLILLGQRAPKKQGKISDKDYWQNIIKSGNKYILAESYNNYAVCLIKEGNLEKAKEQLDIAKKINSNLKEIYYNLALINYIRKDYNEALRLIEEYFKYDDFKDVKGNYIKELLSENEYNKSVENQFKKEQYYNANILLVYCYLHQGEIKKATSMSKKFSNNYIESYILADSKQYNKSIKKLTNVLKWVKLANFTGDSTIDNIEYFAENVIYSNLAFVEILKQNYKKALENIRKSKNYSFSHNDISLYVKNINLENYILFKLKE